MADLDPLKYIVAIQDEATSQLDNIDKKFQELQDKTISVKVEGLADLRNLLSALQHQQVNNLGNDLGKELGKAAEGLQEKSQEAIRASLGDLAKNLALVKEAIQHDNFTAFSKRIEKCAESVNTLSAAFANFHVTVGKDEGMRNFMAGLGEVIRNVRATMTQLEGSKGAGGKGHPDGQLDAQQLQVLRETIREKERAKNVTQQHTTEELHLARAMERSTRAASTYTRVLSGLKSMATQYLGVWGSQQFINNIIEIGGQLEMQRLSIGAILQNQSQANTLFNQVTGLATHSPYGVVQLDQMTKQLTAYGFKYHELFDITKRLADISAATGTSVDRLALALGHVRSETTLSGYTLRQFSMGNVPLLEKLSEKLGKTTKEIREMVSKKQISYDDVVGVLKDLTDEGGMFYNMQEVISESVRAKFKNVKDAMDIMYGEMAEGGIGDSLKDVADLLMALTKNWKDVATIGGTVAVMWGVNRAAVLLYTQVLGQNNATTLASITAHQRKRAEQLKQIATYRTLTEEEKELLETAKKLSTQERLRVALGMSLSTAQKRKIILLGQERVAMLANELSAKRLTAEDILRQVALNKLSKIQARQIINLSNLTDEEKKYAIGNLRTTQRLGAFRIGILNAGNAIKTLGTAMKALLASPHMWLMAGITAITELSMRNKQEMEKAAELADSIYQHSQDAIKNTRTLMQNSGMSFVSVDDDGNAQEMSDSELNLSTITNVKMRVNLDDASGTEMQQKIDEWTDYIKNYAANAGQILNEASFAADGSLLSLEERCRNLAVAVKEVALAQYALQDLGDVFSNAAKRTDGGWFDNGVLKDIADYEKTYKKFGSSVASIYLKYQEAIDKGIAAVEKQDSAFAEATAGMNTYAQKFRFLAENHEDYLSAVQAFQSGNILRKNAMSEIRNNGFFETDLRNLQKSHREMERELNQYYTQIKAELQTKGVDLAKLTKEQGQSLLIGYKKMLDSNGVTDKSLFDSLMMRFAEEFNIKLSLEDSEFVPKVDETKALLDELVGGKYDVPINFSTDIEDAIDKARKDYKSAKEYFEKVEPILVKFGIEFEQGTDLTEEQIQKALEKADPEHSNALEKVLRGLNENNQRSNNATTVAAELGFTLDDGKKNDEDLIDEARKQYKSAKEYFEKVEPILVKFGIEYKKGKKLDVNEVLSNITGLSEQDRKNLEEVLNAWNVQAQEYGEAEDKSKTLGFSLENEKGSYKDEYAKRWDERIRIMKEAYGWYEKWDKKVGNAAAIEETNSRYGDIFGEWKSDKLLPMDFDVKEIADYAQYVEKIRDDALKRYEAQKNDPSKKNGEEALRVYRQAVDLLNDVKFDNFTRAAEEFKSIIEQTINDLTDRWNIFNTVRDATGNMVLASSVAGFGNIDEGARTAADAMRNELVLQLDNVGGNISLLPSVPIDEHLDESTLRAKLEAATPDEYKSKIDGLIKTYREWQKLQRQVVNDDISVFANLIGSVVNYDAQMKKLDSNLEKEIASVNALRNDNKITQEQADHAINIAQTRTDWEKMKLSSEYANIYNNAIAMSKKEFDSATTALENLLVKLRELGLISQEDYVSETDKLNNARQEWDTTGFLGMRGAVGQFISGGNDGLKNYYLERAGKARENAERETDPEMKKKYDAESKHYQELAEELAKAADSAEDLCNAFSILQSGLDLVSGLFESLGMEGAANGVGDAASVVGSTLQGAQSLSALGHWGMAAGAAIGLVSGIANVKDEQLAREMEDLNETVSSIEMNTRAIDRARERTLGYDNGDLRRSYAKIENTRLSNNLSKATLFDTSAITPSMTMTAYYRTNSSGTGYQQEYNNLLSQKKAQEERLKNLDDDKDATQSDIDETKEKIAELNEQILHFTEDLAKELWGIDFKGWSDQIGDSLMTAFENGESAADAFNETVKNIMKSVAKEMLVLGFIEPLMNNLKKKLFGELDENGNRVGGVVSEDEMLNDPKGAATKVLGAMGEYFAPGGEGSAMIVATQAYLEGVDTLMRQLGYEDGLMSGDNADTLSASIQGTSEETSTLLAGYVNALRQDVAVNRIMMTQFVAELWPTYMDAFVIHVRTVTRIDSNVQTMMEMMRDGNGAMYDEIAAMRSRLDSVVDASNRVKVV